MIYSTMEVQSFAGFCTILLYHFAAQDFVAAQHTLGVAIQEDLLPESLFYLLVDIYEEISGEVFPDED